MNGAGCQFRCTLSLANLEAFVKLPGDFPVAKLKFKYHICGGRNGLFTVA